jgi:hypothetical protein
VSDMLRICAILLALVVCATLPWAIGYENPPDEGDSEAVRKEDLDG